MSRPVSAALLTAGLVLVVGCAPAGTSPAKPAPTASVAPAPAALTTPAAPAAPAAPPPRETVRVSFAADAAVYAPFFIAVDKGYLAEEGLEMEIVRMGGGVATPALIAGEIAYSTSAASSVSAILQGAPLKVVYTNADRPLDELWSGSPAIRTLADLPGHTVGIQTRGDTMEIETRLILQQYGLDPNSVIYTAMGVGAQRLAAIEAGTIGAAILSISNVAQLSPETRAKRHRLASIRDEVQMLYTGMATSDRELLERRDRVKRILRASVKGREYFKAFRDEAITILSKYNGLPREVNEADYDATLPAMTEDGGMPEEVQRRDTAVRAEVNGLAHYPPPEQIYDYSVVREVYRELRGAGWQPAR